MKNRRFIWVVVFFSLFIQFIEAQIQQIDSLEKVLVNTVDAEKKIHIKLQLVDVYNEFNQKKAAAYLKELIKDEKNIVNKEDFVTYCILRVLSSKEKGYFTESKKWASIALKESNKLADSISLKVRLNYLLGAIADDESNIKLAISYHLKALKFSERSKNNSYKATVLGGIGRAYMYLSEYKKAKKYLLRAIRLKNKNKQFDKHLAGYYENLSSCFDEEKDYAKSLLYINKVIEMYKKNHTLVSLVSSYNNKAYTLLLMHKLNEAEQTIKKAFQLADSIHINESEKMFPYSTYAEILFAQNKTEKALYNINKSIALSKKYKDLYLEKYNLNLVYQIYLRQHNYKKALEYFQKKKVVLDSIHNLKKRKELENLMLSYETEKKNKTILLLEKEKQLNQIALTKSRWFQIAFLLLILLLIVLLIFLRTSYKNKVKTEQLLKQSLRDNYEKKIKESELQTLRSQMNPHFLFNSLNSINSFIIKNDKEQASEYLLNFSRLIRNVLHNSKQSKITLQKELETLELYVKMELLRFSNKFNFILFVQNNIEADYIEVPPLILQPFVENSIRHGISKKKNGTIKVEVTQEKEILIISIEDDGMGREAAKNLKKAKNLHRTSYGIKITKERLDLINQSNNKFKSLEIIDLVDEHQNAIGTKVIIKIKL